MVKFLVEVRKSLYVAKDHYSYALQTSAVVVALIIMLGFGCRVHGQQVPGPMNITRDEGWTDEPVECPFQAPIWAINSTLFEPLALMPPLIPTTTGITIKVVERSLNNTTFQCFSPNGTELDVHKSQVGTLSVIKKGMAF